MNEHGAVDWEKMWATPDEMDWTIGCEHKLLRKHINLITGGKPNARILVPFCGKDPEIPWLLSEGYTVVGIEFVEVAVKGLFSDAKMEYIVEDCPEMKGSKYTSADGKLIVFKADLFHCKRDIIGLCDGAWDRGAFEAVSTLQEKIGYAEVVMSCLAPGAKCVISYFKFLGYEHGDSEEHQHGGHEHGEDETACEEFSGHDIDLSVVQKSFGKFGTCQEIDQWDATEYVSGKYQITDIFYLITPPQ